jgi:hypothetical protein
LTPRNSAIRVRHRSAAASPTPHLYGDPIQDISDTVGHKSTHVTETVYRHVIVPQIRGGAAVMDNVFGDTGEDDRDIA